MTAGTSSKRFFMQKRMERLGRYWGSEEGREEMFTWKRSSFVMLVSGLRLGALLQSEIRCLICSSSLSTGSCTCWSGSLVSLLVDMFLVYLEEVE